MVYVLANRSVADVVLLDIIAEQRGLRSPGAPLDGLDEQRRFFFLNRPAGLWRRNTMRRIPERMRRLEAKLRDREDRLYLMPVSIFWGRAGRKDRSWLRALFSDGWAASSRLRRFLILLLNRGDILVQLGQPLPWHGDALRDLAPEHSLRRTARLLRVKFRNQRVRVLGPDLSHRRTLMGQILRSSQVGAAIAAETGAAEDRAGERAARAAARSIAADMSYPAVRFLDALLTWFWSRIYDGVRVDGIERVAALAETHTLVYAPCHRSHIDYLLLSYVLYHRGFMLPHIASGDNLDMPVVGALLRSGGAFFMRRSFRGDRIYRTVFAEYLYQVFRRGHSVEYFVEGGRTRTGRLLPPRTGMLQMTIEAHRRGVPRPIVFVPVYIGYDKLIEAGSYVDELRGSDKQRETVGGVFRSLRLVRQSYGEAQLSFGKPIPLDAALDAVSDAASERPERALGARLVAGINACAFVNGMNLVALASLSMPRQAIDEQALTVQIDLLRDLIARDAAHHDYRVVDMPAADIVRHAELLGMLDRETTRGDEGDILSHDAFTAILMTWYRNNVLHVLAAPAFIACTIVNRRIGVRRRDVRRLFDAIFPYVERELQTDGADSADRWIGHLRAAGLIELRGNAFVAPTQPAARFRLRLLANALMPVLERFYIGVVLLARSGSGMIDRAGLLADWRRTASRISRLYGINAPEFSDPRLCEGFLQGLTEADLVRANADGKLVFDERIDMAVRAAKGVIAVELRQALET